MELSLIAPPSFKEWQQVTNLLPGRFCIASVAIKNKEYREFFRDEAARGCKVILDNGVFEEDLITDEELIELSWNIGAHTLIIPDILCGNFDENEHKAAYFINLIKHMHSLQVIEPYNPIPKLMFVPQCRKNDEHGFWQSLIWAIQHQDIDCIGICRDACRNAFMQWTHTDDQELNRFYFASAAVQEGSVYNAREKDTKWHFLGVGDNVHIIENYWFVDSMDTASFFWQAYNNNEIKNGRLVTKYKRPSNYFERHYDYDSMYERSDVAFAIEQNCLEAQRYADLAAKKRRKILGGRI